MPPYDLKRSQLKPEGGNVLGFEHVVDSALLSGAGNPPGFALWAMDLSNCRKKRSDKKGRGCSPAPEYKGAVFWMDCNGVRAAPLAWAGCGMDAS